MTTPFTTFESGWLHFRSTVLKDAPNDAKDQIDAIRDTFFAGGLAATRYMRVAIQQMDPEEARLAFVALLKEFDAYKADAIRRVQESE